MHRIHDISTLFYASTCPTLLFQISIRIYILFYIFGNFLCLGFKIKQDCLEISNRFQLYLFLLTIIFENKISDILHIVFFNITEKIVCKSVCEFDKEILIGSKKNTNNTNNYKEDLNKDINIWFYPKYYIFF